MDNINNNNQRYQVAVDLGTSKISLAVAKSEGESKKVLYYNVVESVGMSDGEIMVPKKVREVVKELIRDAEKDLNIVITHVAVGLPRCYIRKEQTSVSIPRNESNSEITNEELNFLAEQAESEFNNNNNSDERVFETIAQSFNTPDYIQISPDNIVGMIGSSLTGHYINYIGHKRIADQIRSVFDDLNISVTNQYFVPTVTAKTVLSADEMEEGVALVELGAGVSSVSIFKDKVLKHYASIPFGGKIITKDIRSECGITLQLAENIKKAYAGCIPDEPTSWNEKILLVNTNHSTDIEIPVKTLCEIVADRQAEIINALLYGIQESGEMHNLKKGVVLIGEGSKLLQIKDLFSKMSGYNVRLGEIRINFDTTDFVNIRKVGAEAICGILMQAHNDGFQYAIEKPKEEAADTMVGPTEEIPGNTTTVMTGNTPEIIAGKSNDENPQDKTTEQGPTQEEHKDKSNRQNVGKEGTNDQTGESKKETPPGQGSKEDDTKKGNHRKGFSAWISDGLNGIFEKYNESTKEKV